MPAQDEQVPAKGAPGEEAQGSESATVYAISAPARELRQSEIITNLAQYIYDPTQPDRVEERRHRYAVVVAQDCDLLRDFETGEGSAVFNGVLLFELMPFDEAKRALPPGRDIWRPIAENNNERYHFFEAVPPGCDLAGEGLPELIADFRKYFALPSRELYRQCSIAGPEGAKRRCRLEMPYREHLQTRAAFYFQRVVLPNPHKTPGG